jgi:hypothetical protein
MWMTFSTRRDQPVTKPEPKVLPPETVEALVKAAEEIQDKFDVDPTLKDLYYDPFSSLLDEIAKNVKAPETEIALDGSVKPWEIR